MPLRRKTRRVRVGLDSLEYTPALWITGVVIAFGMSCQNKDQRPSLQSDSTATAPKPGRALPIVNSTRIVPKPLTANQQTSIRELCEAKYADQTIWFVYVRSNYDQYYLVNVYFEPSQRNRRVQHGQFARVSNGSLLLSSVGEKMGGTSSAPAIQSSIAEYVYVVPPDRNFASKYLPSGNNLPYEVTANTTDEELIEIVDFYRAGGTSFLPGTSISFPFNKTKPILNLERSSKGLELRTGWDEGFLSGRGEILHLEKKEGVWRVSNIVYWVS